MPTCGDFHGEVSGCPFEIALDGTNGAQRILRCNEIVRQVRGRRLVCRSLWGGRAVFAKLYVDPRRAVRHRRREARGLRVMAQRGVAAPRILHEGSAGAGTLQVLVLEEIHGARSVQDAWTQTDSEAARLQLLHGMSQLLAHHHARGIMQRDLHLGNFLLADDEIHTLDGSTVWAGRDPVPTGRALDNLARYLAQHPPQYDRLIQDALHVYCATRGWNPDARLAARLRSRVRHWRLRRRAQYLRKAFRSCTEFTASEQWRRFAVYRSDDESAALTDLLVDPDASLNQPEAHLLKAGNTCTVWSVPVDGRRLVVKRYNMKNWRHRLSRAPRSSRAAICWRNAHRLRLYGIATAAPVAMLEERVGPLRGRAWYVAEEVVGTAAADFFADTTVAPSLREEVAVRLVNVLRNLAGCRISHGDMKASNFIIEGDLPVVVDLDAMREHATAWHHRYRMSRDLDRFMENWRDQRETRELFERLIGEALTSS
jgi:tRNA A-37 threonylcarbamoyl transferase component Bud32